MNARGPQVEQSEATRGTLGIHALLPVVVGVLLLLGAGYLLYARARIEAAIADLSQRAGLSVRYHASSSWYPGRVRLRDLIIESHAQDWSLRLEQIDVALVPVLGGPRSIRLEFPEQWVQLEAASVRWKSLLRADGELVGLTAFGLRAVRRAAIDLRDGVLQLESRALRVVTAELMMTRRSQPRDEARLRGRLSVRGASGAELLALGPESLMRWLSPAAVRKPFELNSEISWTAARVEVEPLSVRSGEVSLEGGLELRSDGATGALLLKTSLGAVELRFPHAHIRSDVTPEPVRLERHLAVPPDFTQRPQSL